MFKKIIFSLQLLILLVVSSISQAQIFTDTLSLNIHQAEKQFVDSNFLLLAAHYNVDAQKALIEQAKLWQNPTINTDLMIGADGKFFKYGKYDDGRGNNFLGQYYVQVQQLILTAGKRGKLIKLATTNAQLAELQLKDVMRNLRYQLHQDFYTLQQQLSLLSLFNTQKQQLDKLLAGMQAQFLVGNIAQKDVVRIEALVVALQQDITDLNKSIADTENDFKTLLQIKDSKKFIKPSKIDAVTVSVNDNLDKLINEALQNNPNYLLQKATNTYQKQNVDYQKALAKPDVTLGPNFDRNSNFTPNYVGLGVSMPLPVLNKNQGNIKSAKSALKQQEAFTQNAETDLTNSVTNAYQKLLLTVNQNNQKQEAFYKDYETIYTNMLASYKLRQLSLLEFLDFYNDYTDLQQRLIQQQLNLHLANEELMFNVGR